MAMDATAHFAFGMMATAIVVTLFWAEAPYPRSVAVVGGMWSAMPNLVLGVPVIGAAFHWLVGHPVSNVFWFHTLLDIFVSGAGFDRVSGHRVTAVFLLLLGLTMVWAERRSYRTPEPIRSALSTDG